MASKENEEAENSENTNKKEDDNEDENNLNDRGDNQSNNNHASSSDTSDTTNFPKLRNFKNRSYRSHSFTNDSNHSTSSIDSNHTTSNDEDEPSEVWSRENVGCCDTVGLETDSDDTQDSPVPQKEQPKHNWFMLKEVINRQVGYSLNQQSSDLFQKRCYSSLHCAKRLTIVNSLNGHRGCVNCVNFHHNGSLLASGSDDLRVILWDFNKSKTLLKYDSKHRSNIFQSKFLPLSGDLHVVTCARDGQVRLSQISVQEGVRSNVKLGQHKEACHKLAILKNQPQVCLSAGEDGVVFSYDVRDPKPVCVLQLIKTSTGTRIPLYSINSHPLNSHEFCICGRDDKVRTYDTRKAGSSNNTIAKYYAENPSRNDKPPEDRMHITCAVYNHNGSEILASYNDGDIFLFDTNSTLGTYVHRYQGHRNADTIKGVNFFGPKSEYVISGSDCGNLFLWEKNTECVVNFKSGDVNGVVNCLEPHPQLPFLATSGLDWDIKVWMPSLSEDVVMSGLEEQIKENISMSVNDLGEIREGQLLWMLWRRHLNNMDANNSHEPRMNDFVAATNSSDSSLSDPFVSDSDDDSDNIQDPNCVAS